MTDEARSPLDWLRRTVRYWQLPAAAREEQRRDSRLWPAADIAPQPVIDEGIAWLGRAQDNSKSADGGVARHYSLTRGWAASYPETTGYIIPTMLAYARAHGDAAVRDRARRMLDWLVKIQMPDGGFQGGIIGETSPGSVTFNTGQILMGLAAGQVEFGAYMEPMRRAADWLVRTQDEDGGWRKHGSPFTEPGEKTYETHVAWGLMEAARVVADAPYGKAALANVDWALRHQRANGWFENCCLTDPVRPLTHTIGYVLRGVVEAFLLSRDQKYLRAAIKTADGVLGAVRPDGILPGRLDAEWRAAVDWSCLTGAAQIAICWLQLFQATGDARYRDAARRVNRMLRRTVRIDGPSATRGAVKGSFPVNGGYGRFEYLNWACKFLIDANMMELGVVELAA